ncbi:plasmid replication protein RepB [Zhongshania antarctica]|nr:plasmid replication protein RepB [Zhongshania antarctica]
MEIRMLRQMFQEGLLRTATIIPAPMERDRWMLVFQKANGNQERITKARTENDKVYKRLNGALSDAQDIGFRSVTVEFNES